jgi:hypothetical protein
MTWKGLVTAVSVALLWITVAEGGERLADSVAPASPVVPSVVVKDNDDQPIAEPAKDDEGDYIWWDGVYNMAVRPLTRLADVAGDARTVGEWLGMVGPAEAANVSSLDEAPDSTWFTNRHARTPLSPADIARGAPPAKAPAADGPLVILSGKSLGMTPGFVMRDQNGDRFVVKFDPARYPEVATGAELVCSRIVWALGWNVPDNQLFLFRPERLEIADGATAKDEHNRKVSFTRELLERQLRNAYHLPDGRVRALASRLIVGEPKGSPRLVGTRADDPNDTVPHEDRRDFRGLRVVAAFLNYTDARRGNFFDTFVRDDPEKHGSPGHLLHYVLDFSSALGSGNDDWKDPKRGNEYLFDLAKVVPRLLTLGYLSPAWSRLPLTHPALGYFESSLFDPDEWKTSYSNLAFDRATVRDRFWGAKLVASLTDADLRAAVHAGHWSDPRAEELLFAILAERKRRIARAYFDSTRIDPADRFEVHGDELGFTDLAADAGVVDRSVVRFRCRTSEGRTTETAEARCPIDGGAVEIATSHDLGESWSPPTVVRLARADGSVHLVEIERATR